MHERQGPRDPPHRTGHGRSATGHPRRAVYVAGLPYSFDNARLLHRAIYWAAGREDQFDSQWIPSDPGVEIAVFPNAGKAFVMNNRTEAASATVSGRVGGLAAEGEAHTVELELKPMESRWIELA